MKYLLPINLLVLLSCVMTARILDRRCDYCHDGDNYDESPIVRLQRRLDNTPLLHPSCAEYLCREGIMKQWRIDNGFAPTNLTFTKNPKSQQCTH